MFFKTILRPITNAEKAESVGLLMVRRAHNGSVKRFSRPLLQTKDVRARVGVAKRQAGGCSNDMQADRGPSHPIGRFPRDEMSPKVQ